MQGMSAMTGRTDFWLRHLGPALVIAAVLLALDTTRLDSVISNWFFDPVAGVFPRRHDKALEVLGHQWAKELIVLVVGCVIGMYFLSFLQPALAPHRRLLLFLSLALTLAPLAVVLLKMSSPRHCPWSMQEYGGFAPRLSLFQAAPPGLPPGHCFPSGHASAGFALLAFYFAGRTLGNRRLAHAGLWGGLAAGMAFGMVRIVQGAHFLSHNLWSALVCWLVILALYVAIMGVPGEQDPRTGLEGYGSLP
jgi:membrane-associated PAP2 superfamily phosphatase